MFAILAVKYKYHMNITHKVIFFQTLKKQQILQGTTTFFLPITLFLFSPTFPTEKPVFKSLKSGCNN